MHWVLMLLMKIITYENNTRLQKYYLHLIIPHTRVSTEGLWTSFKYLLDILYMLQNYMLALEIAIDELLKRYGWPGGQCRNVITMTS